MGKLEYTDELVSEISAALSTVDNELAERLADAILSAPHVFVSGSGRSGLGIRGFAMRLMHMQIPAYVIGEAVTPGIQPGDLLIVASGSGETGSQVVISQKAKKLGGKIGLITIAPGSSIDAIADYPVYINVPTSKVEQQEGVKVSSIQPMASLFEQSTWLTLDSLVLKLMRKKGLDSDRMYANHANLE